MSDNIVGRQACGCTVETTYIDRVDVYSVQQCPLHKVAPELLEALEWATGLLTQLVKMKTLTIDPHYPKPGESNYSLKKALKFIAKAKGTA